MSVQSAGMKRSCELERILGRLFVVPTGIGGKVAVRTGNGKVAVLTGNGCVVYWISLHGKSFMHDQQEDFLSTAFVAMLFADLGRGRLS